MKMRRNNFISFFLSFSSLWTSTIINHAPPSQSPPTLRPHNHRRPRHSLPSSLPPTTAQICLFRQQLMFCLPRPPKHTNSSPTVDNHWNSLIRHQITYMSGCTRTRWERDHRLVAAREHNERSTVNGRRWENSLVKERVMSMNGCGWELDRDDELKALAKTERRLLACKRGGRLYCFFFFLFMHRLYIEKEETIIV